MLFSWNPRTNTPEASNVFSMHCARIDKTCRACWSGHLHSPFSASAAKSSCFSLPRSFADSLRSSSRRPRLS